MHWRVDRGKVYCPMPPIPHFPPVSPPYGCGRIDAAPQVHVRLAKKVYPKKREVMGYPAIPGAPFDLPRRRR
jgi:hypothetical protein